MKSKTQLSTYSLILTVVIIAAFIMGCFFTWSQKPFFYTLLVLFMIMLLSGLWFAPLAIEADSDSVSVVSPFKVHTIPMSEIESVELFKPTMGAVRICGSGGFMGYWGLFSEGDVGKYTAFYGKASDCFLLRLRDGRKYLLGCENPSGMVDYIRSYSDRGDRIL